MAKKPPSPNATSLVIVESPAKARTIGKFLGRGYTIEASIGHIRDLPKGAKEVPAEFKQEDWAYLGVNVNQDFEPVYVISPKKAQQVRILKAALKDAKDLYLATDEDREGEAISWHLCEVLQPKVPVHRLVFHEITEQAIRDALKHPRAIDQELVRAQEVRRIVDRLYGYDVSPLLWKKVRPGLSAGRVQSVAVRLIVERERARMAFRAATYWDLIATFAKSSGEAFGAVLVSVDGRRIPASRDFDPATGQLKDPGCLLLDHEQASALAEKLQHESVRVAEMEDKPYTTKPYPPFTTSTLQQDANRKYGFTARRTMDVAQSLYENGHITYMRTDSTNLAAVAIDMARKIIASQYGADYLPDAPRIYQTKVKNAQEAHEAIRPAGNEFPLPESLRNVLSPDEFRLYDLIWKRTVASQMSDAKARRITIRVDIGGEGTVPIFVSAKMGLSPSPVSGARFEASGKIIDFPGYLRAYVEGSDDPDSELAEREVVLPQVAIGESLKCRELESKSHTTQPPNRFSEASLTRELEKMGIGRPSTYASIIDTILARDYVFKKSGNVLIPTWTAFAVSQLLESHLPDLVDYQFTAKMEDELDEISRGELDYLAYLRQFYFGKDAKGLKDLVTTKSGEINARDVCRIPIGQPEGQEAVFVRVGKFGPFLEQGERHASIPDLTPPDELTLEASLKLLETSSQSEEPLGHDPDGKPVYLKVGRYGPYVQRGNADDEEKPQNASLLKDMAPADVTLEIALKLLTLPRTLGNHPQSELPVMAFNGKFGPYIKCGGDDKPETRSLPAGLSPLDVTLEQALELLAQPKAMGRGRGAKREPLKVFDASPVTGSPVQLLAGRFGAYVTDGVTNATLPRGTAPEELTFEYALSLLKTRAEAPPSDRQLKKAAAKKAAEAKKAAAKKAVPKKTAKKAAPKAKKAAKKTAKKAEEDEPF